MFWERYYELCNKNKTKPNPVAAIIGVSSGVVTKWKQGTIPNGETLIKLADYFNCSVDYLLGRTDCPDLMIKDKDGNTAIIELKRTQNVYKAKIAASDGSFNKEITLTDSDIEKIDALPDADDI